MLSHPPNRHGRLIDELKSPRLRIVLDPANLFEIALPRESQVIIARAVDLLGDRIVMAHAKDRRANWRIYRRRLRRH